MSARLVALAAAGLAACVSPPIPVAGEADDPGLDGPRVLEAAFLRRADVIEAASRTAPAPLRERLVLLAAVTTARRGERLERIEVLADETDDALLKKTADHLLEQDDAWFAASLDAERRESWWSSFVDGLGRTASAAIQGNPIGTVRPLVEGVDGLLRPDELDALDRKELALSRRWLVAHPDGTGLPAGADAIRERTDVLRGAVYEQELRLFDLLLGEGKLDAAATHLHVASVREPHADAVRTRGEALETAMERISSRVRAALAVAPAEVEMRLVDPAGFEACRRLGEEMLRGRAGAADCDDVAAAADVEGWGGVAASLRRAGAAWSPRDPWVRVSAAEKELSRRKRRFLLTGERESDDPTARYREAADPGGFRVTDIFVPLLWVPATLARAISLGVGRPVDDRPVVDALAALSWGATDELVRAEALRQLADRYQGRDEYERALATARAVPLDDAELEPIEEEASEEAFRRADRVASERLRRAALEDVAVRFDTKKGGERARERLAELDVERDTRTPALPATALRPIADRLGVAPHLVDGRRTNGEVAEPGFRLHEDRVTWELDVDGDRRSYERRLDDDLASSLQPIVEEWAWRRRVARSETFREAHEGVPVEFRTGAGIGGVSFLPRLLPEVYRGRDRRFYTP